MPHRFQPARRVQLRHLDNVHYSSQWGIPSGAFAEPNRSSWPTFCTLELQINKMAQDLAAQFPRGAVLQLVSKSHFQNTFPLQRHQPDRRQRQQGLWSTHRPELERSYERTELRHRTTLHRTTLHRTTLHSKRHRISALSTKHTDKEQWQTSSKGSWHALRKWSDVKCSDVEWTDVIYAKTGHDPHSSD